MSNIVPNATPTTKLTKDAQMEAERMQDVVLLLERLAAHDETTVRLIMDCLYDIGSVHFANQKLPNPALNKLMRGMSRMSKPVFRLFAVKWFQKYCPQLIADWLYTVATFQVQQPIEIPPETIDVMQQLEVSQRQVRALQTKVKCLTGVAVGLVLILGGTIATSSNLIPGTFAGQPVPKQSVRPVKMRLADQLVP
ncbi:hypothetical protein IQ266_03815 [filamentous cyanobacterium LEGE 11480]|uniref:Uncharacterized protein n=1 Tax=Romeriopsis navalis LEGE 11480 TaxID=2777977 RepID=A0A928VJP6_9CYAN|nr:hypothetical protein [Romeriopsis navalis]MBE9028887.1 hypothetical protein [Romeriopsis navalis LEGE 11480]